MMKKDQLMQKLLLWPQVSFKQGINKQRVICKTANYFVRSIKSQYTMFNKEVDINLNLYVVESQILTPENENSINRKTES